MRAGPQLGVDAFSISNYGSAMFAQVQPQHSPLMLLTFAKTIILGRRFRILKMKKSHLLL